MLGKVWANLENLDAGAGKSVQCLKIGYNRSGKFGRMEKGGRDASIPLERVGLGVRPSNRALRSTELIFAFFARQGSDSRSAPEGARPSPTAREHSKALHGPISGPKTAVFALSDGPQPITSPCTFSTLCVRQIKPHSPRAFSSPRNRNCRIPRACLICPNTGSTIAFRCE